MSLIVFEGIDRSGKSSLSVKFAQYLNNAKDADGCMTIDPHFGPFVWTKEPNFSSEEADLLNSPGYVDEYKRERLFFESRLRHQNFLAGKNIVCDRYIWTGLAYAYKYSKGAYMFAKELYSSEAMFMQPDLYIFLDTPPEVCASRDASLDINILNDLRDAFLLTQEYIQTPIIILPAIEGEQSTLEALIKMFETFIYTKNKK
jgi:thymidylate kinase